MAGEESPLETVVVERPRIREVIGSGVGTFVPFGTQTPGLSPEFGFGADVGDAEPEPERRSSRDTGKKDRSKKRGDKRTTSRSRGPRDTPRPRKRFQSTRPPNYEPLRNFSPPAETPRQPDLGKLFGKQPAIDLSLPYTETIEVTGRRGIWSAVGTALGRIAGGLFNLGGLLLTPSPLADSDLGYRAPGRVDQPVGPPDEVLVTAPRLPYEPLPLPLGSLPTGTIDAPTPGGIFGDVGGSEEPIPVPPVAIPIPDTPTLPLPLTPTLPLPATPTLPLPQTPQLPLPQTPQLPLPQTPQLPLPQIPTPVQIPTPTPQLPPQYLVSPRPPTPTPTPLPGGLTPSKPPGLPLPPLLAFPPSAPGGRGGCKPCKPCKPKKKKKKKKKSQPRTECWRGVYTEKSRGLSKKRRVRVDCVTGAELPTPRT